MDPSLHVSKQSVESLLDPTYWAKLVPWLHVNSTFTQPVRSVWSSSSSSSQPLSSTVSSFSSYSSTSASSSRPNSSSFHSSSIEIQALQHLKHYGFIKLDHHTDTLPTTSSSSYTPSVAQYSSACTSTSVQFPSPTWPSGLLERVARGILRLVEAGHTASFILIYDEVWYIQESIKSLLYTISGGNVPLGDWYIFCINPPVSILGNRYPRTRTTADEDNTQEENDDEDDDEDNNEEQRSDDDDDSTRSNGIAAGKYKSWPPHRDRPMNNPKAIEASFRHTEDLSSCADDYKDYRLDTSKYTTVWIPLTEASPQTSCLYVIPRSLDPGYMDGDKEADNPLSAAIQHSTDFQKILALPAIPGSIVAFSHRLLHWGSKPLESIPGTPPPAPRIALSLAFSDPSFEEPYIVKNWKDFIPEERNEEERQILMKWDSVYLPHKLRLGLIAGQSLTYDHQVPLTKRQAKIASRLFHLSRKYFNTAYAEKVVSTGKWSAFKKSAVQNIQSLRRTTGAPSQDDINLLFCALASAKEGIDAEDYL